MFSFASSKTARQARSPRWYQHKPRTELKDIFQPIVVPFVPSEEKSVSLTITQFIELIVKQEDYFTPERIADNPLLAKQYDSPPSNMAEVKQNTKLMITLLRKCFYDQGGWDSELIRGNNKIPGRYDQILNLNEDYWVKIVWFQPLGWLFPFLTNARDRSRRVVFRPSDPDYDPHNPLRQPEFYRDNNQTVILEPPTNDYADMGHMFCGLDAANYPQPVSPLPSFLFFLKKLGPYIRRNIDAVCWIGDVASSAGECLYLYSKQAYTSSVNDQQEVIERMAPGDDMHGNIDGLILPLCYDIASRKGMAPSEIMTHYYLSDEGAKYRHNKFRLFCMSVGIEIDDAGKMTNRETWIKDYYRDIKDATCFYILDRGGRLGRFLQTLLAYLGFINKIIKPDKFLGILFDALVPLIEKETANQSWDLLRDEDLTNINQRLEWMMNVQPMQPLDGEGQ